ncbi:MAG: LPXTG cell wall anchor domain-containing protein [Helicobacteraceae bacterium]|nr:LPXTG cell wall anchor domain-containing protein [Helicobacteraceae bacterium]
MGLFGDTNTQITTSNSFNLDFEPIFQIGDGNSTANEKVIDQTSTLSPKQDNSFGAAASVGVAGGSGGPATFSRAQEEPQAYNVAPQPISAYKANTSSDSTMYIVGGVVVLLGGFFLYKKKK